MLSARYVAAITNAALQTQVHSIRLAGAKRQALAPRHWQRCLKTKLTGRVCARAVRRVCLNKRVCGRRKKRGQK